MNHDYAHCSDFTERCPKDCFRAQLERDLRKRWAELIGCPISYADMRGTKNCPITVKKLENLVGGKMEVEE
jgi:hypothetical protein